jgi:hypothetical protein
MRRAHDLTGETDLPDLDGLTMERIRALPRDQIEAHIEHMITQVRSPRVNLGGNGPPGRVD